MPPSLSASQLQDVLASFPDPVFLLTRSGRYAAVYGGTDSRYYHDGSGLVGKRLHDVLKPEKAEWFLAEIARALNSKGLHIVEYGLAGSDVLGLDIAGPGETIWFEGRIQPLTFLIDGEDGVLWVASNITARMSIESQLTDAMRREREAIDILWRRIASSQLNKTNSRWVLDAERTQLAAASGEIIVLTRSETQLLVCLAEADGSLVSKDALSARLFPGADAVEGERINVLLSRLRQKLTRHQSGVLIRSVFGKGLALTESLHVLQSRSMVER